MTLGCTLIMFLFQSDKNSGCYGIFSSQRLPLTISAVSFGMFIFIEKSSPFHVTFVQIADV